MGTKTPTGVKEKRAIPCEECQREFQSKAAWVSHTNAKHPEKYKIMQRTSENAGDEKKTAFVPPTSRASKRLLQKKSVDKDISEAPEPSGSVVENKICFECPKCPKIFPVYFSAHKHIQKRHCEDEYGNPVMLHSPKLIKPLRKEMCGKCSNIINGIHKCEDMAHSVDFMTADNSAKGSKGMYCCLGCQRNFVSIAMFDRHVALSHSDNIETMLFSNSNEFMFWKTDVESQLKIKYQQLYKTPLRLYYHCNYVSMKNSAQVTHLCPSILMTKQLPKGIQVDFHKEHFEHSCEYKMPKQYEEFIITKDNAFDRLKGDDDLYVKLKNTLRNVTLGAVKLETQNLKKLYNMAHDMQLCLSKFQQEENMIKKKQFSISFDGESVSSIDNNDRDPVENDRDVIENDRDLPENEITDKENTNTNTADKSMTDDQITKALEPSRVSARLKRKSNMSSPISKKKRLDNEDQILSSPTLNKKKLDIEVKSLSSPILKKKKLEHDVKGLKENNYITKDPLDSPKFNSKSPISQSPSFNDTYKQFIDSTLKVSKKNPLSIGKKESPFAAKKVKETNAASKKVLSPTGKKPISPSTRKNKKDIVKTKIGQFSPKKLHREEPDVNKPEGLKRPLQNVDIKKKQDNVILKKYRASLKSPVTKIADLSLDRVEFEVVEQENDCNILVLKI